MKRSARGGSELSLFSNDTVKRPRRAVQLSTSTDLVRFECVFICFQGIWHRLHSHWCCHGTRGERSSSLSSVLCWSDPSVKMFSPEPISTNSAFLDHILGLNTNPLLWLVGFVCRNMFTRFLFFFTGGHQTDQSAEAAEERADHQWDPGHEGAEEPQHRKLCGQVTPTHTAETHEKETAHRTNVCV